MSGTAQPIAHSPRTLSARSHHVITGRHVALKAVIAPLGMADGNVQIAFATDNPVKTHAVVERQPVGAQSR